MGIVDVRPYIKARMKTLGYDQWDDGFNRENIPSSLLDRVYHLATDRGNGVRHTQLDLEIEMPFTISVFRKGFRCVDDGYDASLLAVDQILKEVMKVDNAKTQANIKDIILENFEVEAFSESNDNIFLITIDLRAFIIFDVNS